MYSHPQIKKRVFQKDRAKYLGASLFKGHMHSHTSLSDGILLPNDAYNFVKSNTDFDFCSDGTRRDL